MTPARRKIVAQPVLRMTRQRRIILEELQKSCCHPAASELYELVRRRLPRISLGTVYRNLEMLCRCGLARKLELGGGQKRFDGVIENHYHVRCVQCGQIADAHLKPLAKLEAAAGSSSGYEIITHQLEFVGLCPRCRRTGKRTQKDGSTVGNHLQKNRRTPGETRWAV
jgi:Fur family ferric uptake transcriptional regulator